MIVDHITIENFQCFAVPVRLTLSPLTFLYGPNSSGKSAIADAMTLLHEVIFEQPGSVLALVRRWSRRAAGDGAGYLPIRLAIEARDNWVGFGEFEEYLSELDPIEITRRTRRPQGITEIEYTIKIVVELSYKSDASCDGGAISQFDLFVDGNQLIEYRSNSSESSGDGEIKIWVKGPFAQYLSEFVNLESDESAPAIIHETGALFGGRDFFGRFSNAALEQQLNWLLSELLQRISQPVRESPLGVFTVSGDRSILAPSRCKVRTRLSEQHMQVLNGEQPWFVGRLAKAFVERYLADVRGAAVVESMREQGQVPLFGNFGKEQIDRINFALGDLFQFTGYQIVVDVTEVRQAAARSHPTPQAARIASDWNVRIYLIDAHDNALEFEDVGSGISYVLPVLVALSERCSFTHQPELHLHPAMQAQLADLFVERISGDDQTRHILETHSEYLLLRVLRRIRDTHTGKLARRSGRTITPDDVMVYYFDPQDDGTTEVTEIPVNEFGDFLKPWPKGFFEERGKDLFDD